MDKESKLSVVGAGVGGLAASARLASRGYDVTLYEKLPECGGRAHIIEDKGYKFDTGPSFVLMPGFFNEVFEYCKENLEDYLKLKILDVSYKIFFDDGDTFTVYRDADRTRQEFERLKAGSSKASDRFIEETAGIYSAVKPLLYKCFGASDIINSSYWGLINKIKVF